jgi:drug/metabolite transporter (DMT)-like permease
LIAIVTQVAGNVFVSHGMRGTGAIVSASPLDYIRALNPWTVAGICMLAIWMITDLALLSRADLSFVLPVIATSFVLIALVGHFVLGERVSAVRWIGIAFITLGVLTAETTPDRTTRPQGESL